MQSNCANPGSDLLHLTFGYGTAAANNGNPVSQTIVASGYTLTQNYGYDPVNRLKIAVEGAAVPGSMTCPVTTSWCQEYNYDHFGNRWVTSNLSLHLATPTSSAAFSATTNRLTAASYDNAGNMTAHPFITPSGSLAYNANNLATQFTATGMSASYGYDAQGRRVRVTHNGVTTIQVYDAMGRLAVEYSTQAPAQANGVYYQTTDHLGSTRIVTDSGGQVKLRRDFFPFGEEIPASASYGNRHLITDGGQATYNAASGIKQQFTGQERDDTGIDYFKARNYSGPLGRFLSADPDNTGARPGRPQSWNAFAYVENRPCNLVDPTGRQAEGPPLSFCDLYPWTCPTGFPGGRDNRTHPYPDVYDGPWDFNMVEEGRKNALRLLPAAAEMARQALSNEDCAGIFGRGGPDPVTVFNSLFISQDGRYGNVKFEWEEPDKNGKFDVARTSPVKRSWRWFRTSFSKVDITINTLWSGVYRTWNTGNTLENADTLLHELGHDLWFLGRRGAEFKMNDDSTEDAQHNRNLINEKCLSKVSEAAP